MEPRRPRDVVPLSGALTASVAITGHGEPLFLTEDGILGLLGSDGHLLWSLLVAPSQSAPALDAEGNCYVAGSDGQLYAVSARGRLRWVRPLRARPVRGVAVGPAWIAVALETGEVSWFRQNDGRWLAQVDAGGLPAAAPVITQDGSVLLPLQEGAIVRLSPRGVELRTPIPSGARPGAMAIDATGASYVGASDGSFSLISAEGQLRWRVNVGGPVRLSPALTEDGHILVAADRAVITLRPTGERIWKRPVGGRIVAGPLIADDGTVYVATAAPGRSSARAATPGWLVALDPHGAVVLRERLPAPPVPGLNLADHRLWIGLGDGTLRRYAVPQQTLARSPWSKARGGQRNAGTPRLFRAPLPEPARGERPGSAPPAGMNPHPAPVSAPSR
jgi:outer membrane protein assembly factor BamB